MTWFRLQPTFEIELQETRDSAIAKMQAEYQRRGCQSDFLVFGEYGEMHLPESEHRLWSPHLTFYFHPRQELCVVHGRFAPRVNVWTLVWIAYLALVFTAFFGAVGGVTQNMVGEYPWGYWVMVGALVLLGTLYLIAHVGQLWSKDQMQHLREELDRVLQRSGIR